SNLCAVTPDGALKWMFFLGTSSYGSPSVGLDGTIYFGADSGAFFAVDPRGFQKWQFQADGFVETSPALAADGTIYFGSQFNLYSLRQDGTENWRFAANFSGSPALDSSGAIYAATYHNEFYTLNSAGVPVRTFYSLYPIVCSPSSGAEGTVYLMVNDSLYAFYGTNALQASCWPMFRHDKQHTARALQRGLQPPIFLPDGSRALTLTVEPGLSYHLQTSTDLIAWQNLAQLVPTNSPYRFVDTTPPNSSQRFYRLVTP
ncbi:MAG: PQQ-binding-like beta-propeller repeat protein, partial [Limisphaerales bacterium]